MPLKKDKDIIAPFIQGPSMDWNMDDGLYSRFQTWKISCNLILDSELCELSEVRKVNTLLRWSSDFGIKKLKSWHKEPSQLTLDFIWDEYESYCKPQSNELRARYDVLKKLTQGSLPADDWMTKLQSQLHLCNYQPEMEEILLRDLFLFGLQDESFMSKIISEESPDVTIAQLQNKLKRFEAGRATAKYIKSGDAKEVHQVKKSKKHKFKPGNKQGNKPQNAFGKNNQGQKSNNWQQSYGKRKQPSSESKAPPPKKPFQGHGQHAIQVDPSTCMRCGDTRHRPGFSCPAAKYQCKACSKVGHFTSRCLTKPKTVNQITQEEESAYLNAWQDDSNYFICQIRDQKTITKRLYANLPLVQQCHHRHRTYLRARIDPGADVNVMPAVVYKQLTGDTELKNLGPVKCTMRVYTTEAITNLGSLKVFVKYPG